MTVRSRADNSIVISDDDGDVLIVERFPDVDGGPVARVSGSVVELSADDVDALVLWLGRLRYADQAAELVERMRQSYRDVQGRLNSDDQRELVGWQCTRCLHVMDDNPRFCPQCRYTIYRPLLSDADGSVSAGAVQGGS